MVTYENIEQLKADIVAKIYQNFARAITGPILQEVLLSMTDTLDYLKANAEALADEISNRTAADSSLQDAIDGKQNVIEDLAAIRSGASKGATAYQKPASGIPATDLAQAVRNALAAALTAVQPAALEAITILIPQAASAINKLADQAFVNSSIATNTAYYISDNGQPFASLADLQAYTGPLTNNDYAFVVGRDQAGNTIYTRYKYNASTGVWGEEYVLNNSSFTAVQWAAINSGITEALVTEFMAKYRKPATGIPASDLAQAVQDLLAAAETAVQPAALSNYQTIANLVIALSAQSTDAQYPSAKCVYDALNTKIGRMPIVAHASIPVLFEPDADTYQRFDVPVTSLDVHLPEISDTTKVHTIVLSVETGQNASIVFSYPQGTSVEYFDGFLIEDNKKYEINCLFNGQKWIIAYGVIV